MEQIQNKNDMILLFDTYDEESKKLHDSFRLSGFTPPVVVIEEDGFLPEGVQSVVGYFLGDYTKAGNCPGRPLYFNEVEVPDYWEISGNNQKGQIHNMEMERGRIFYAKPEDRRLVKVVDWLDEKGVVRFCDHYNKFGAVYARTTMDAQGKKVMKSFFSPQGKEVLVVNYVTGDIILNDEDRVLFFNDMEGLTIHYFLRANLQQTRIFYNSLWHCFFVSQRLSADSKEDILFWNEKKRPDIPGNMQVILEGKSSRTRFILVQKRDSYEELIRLGANPNMVQLLGYVYPFVKESRYTKEALICTNSDNVAQLTCLVQELPQVHFHIAALTEMSSKLMSFCSFENVFLYPNVKRKTLDVLFEKCDLYLDVNHENEIVSAVSRAFLHNHLIFAFEETVHNRDYIPSEHIYLQNEYPRMIAQVQEILKDASVWEQQLELQRKHACAENSEYFASVIQNVSMTVS